MKKTIVLFFLLTLMFVSSMGGVPHESSSQMISDRISTTKYPPNPQIMTGLSEDIPKILIVYSNTSDVLPLVDNWQNTFLNFGYNSSFIELSHLSNVDLLQFDVIFIDSSVGGNITVDINQFWRSLRNARKPFIMVGHAIDILNDLIEFGQDDYFASSNVILNVTEIGENIFKAPYELTTIHYQNTKPLLLLKYNESLRLGVPVIANSSCTASVFVQRDGLRAFWNAIEDPTKVSQNALQTIFDEIAYLLSTSQDPLSYIFRLQNLGNATGGWSWNHIPIMQSAYQVIDGLVALNKSSVLEYVNATIKNFLSHLRVENGSRTLFRPNIMSDPDYSSTSMALIIIMELGLYNDFNISAIVSSIAESQTTYGGFVLRPGSTLDRVHETYLAIRALSLAGQLNAINTTAAIDFLIGQQLLSGDTGISKMIGGIAPYRGRDEASTVSSYECVYSLMILNSTDLLDIQLLRDWIINNASVNDGSFYIVPPYQIGPINVTESPAFVKGTAAALGVLAHTGGVPSDIYSNSSQWLAQQQLPSGGFNVPGVKYSQVAISKIFTDLVRPVLAANITSIDFDALADFGMNTFMENVGFDIFAQGFDTLYWTSSFANVLLEYYDENITNSNLGEFLRSVLDSNYFLVHINDQYLPIPIEYQYSNLDLDSIWIEWYGVHSAIAYGGLSKFMSSAEIDDFLQAIVSMQVLTGADAGAFRESRDADSPTGFQYTAVATDLLWQMGKLDQIANRQLLETYLLSKFNNGAFETEFTYPYNQFELASTYFGTLAYKDLNLVNSTLAETIKNRVLVNANWTDLASTYYAVETLGLLQDAGFLILSDNINETQIRNLIDAKTNNDGIYYENCSLTPLYTEMIYRLHTRLNDWLAKQKSKIIGVSLSGPATATLGSSVSLNVDVYPVNVEVPSAVTLQIDSFNNRTIQSFTPNGTITISIPSDSSALGDSLISVKIWYAGYQSPAVATHNIYVMGQIIGNVSLDSDEFAKGYPITGSVSFQLSTGNPINDSTIKIAVYNSTYYTMRTYYHINSPYRFEVNFDLSPGNYTFELTVSHTDCNDYVYSSEISIFEPIITEISSEVVNTSHVNELLNISGYLTFQNGTTVENGNVTLTIKNNGGIVYRSSALSQHGWTNFTWTPTSIGEYEIILEYAGEGHILGCSNSTTIIIYKEAVIDIATDNIVMTGTNVSTTFYLHDEFGNGIAGEMIRIRISYDGESYYYTRITNGSGYATLVWSINSATDIEMFVEYFGSDDYTILRTDNTTTIRSISDVSLEIISNDIVYPNSELLIVVHATGTDVSNLTGQSISLAIYDAQNNTIISQTLYFNSTKYASMSWIPSNIGDYWINVSYAGDTYHQSATSTRTVYVRFQTIIDISYNSTVVLNGVFELSTTLHDANGNLLTNSVIKFSVLLNGTSIYTAYVTTINGVANFTWTPEMRGKFDFVVSYAGNETYANSHNSGEIYVLEPVDISYTMIGGLLAGHQFTLNITILGISEPISSGHVIAYLKHAGYIVNGYGITNASGVVQISFKVNYAASYILNITLDDDFTLNNCLINTLNISQIVEITLINPDNEIPLGSTFNLQFVLENESTGVLTGESVLIKVINSTGHIVFQETYITDSSNIFSWKPSYVDLYTIELYYAGKQYFTSAVTSMNLAVKGDAHINVSFDTPVLVGHSQDIYVALIDNANGTIISANISIDIYFGNTKVYSILCESNSTFQYTFNEKGLYEIHAAFNGSLLYASTETTVNLEADIKATLYINTNSTVYLNETIYIECVLQDEAGNSINGVNITFELLSPAYLPLDRNWNITSGNGTTTMYFAPKMIGLLKVRAYITQGQFYIAKDIIQNVVVKTKTSWNVKLQNIIPLMLENVSFTVYLKDSLNQSLGGITAYIGIYDPAGNEVYGSIWSSWSTFITNQSGVVFTFIPQAVGEYIIKVKVYSGDYWDYNQSEFKFDVYSRVTITLNVPDRVSVNESFVISGIICDAAGNGLSGLLLSGRIFDESNTKIYQWSMISATDGTFSKTVNLTELETYTIFLEFYGYLLYLPSHVNKSIDVVLGTRLSISLPESPIYAGDNTSISLKLEDINGKPLEGFMIQFRLTLNGSIIYDLSTVISDGNSKVLYILLKHSGNYSGYVEFPGTTHYLESSLNFTVIVCPSSYLEVGVNSTIYLENTTIPIHLIDDYNRPIGNATIFYVLTGITSLNSSVLTNASGNAFLTLPITDVGNYTLKLSFTGFEKLRGINMTLNLTVLSHIYLVVEPVHIRVLDYCTVLVYLHDDLNRTLDGFTVGLSLFNPNGREIYGSAFSQVTVLTVPASGLNITWLASIAGQYRLIIQYSGIPFYPDAAIEQSIYVLYSSYWSGKTQINATQGQSLSLTYHLYREDNSTVRNVPVSVYIFRNSNLLTASNMSTDFAGVLIIDLEITSWGNYTILIEFEGTSEIASSKYTTIIISEISPELQVDMPQDAVMLNMTTNITIHLVYNGIPVDGQFNITINITKAGEVVRVSKGVLFGQSGYTLIWTPEDVGEYQIKVLVIGNEYVKGVNDTFSIVVQGSSSFQGIISINGDFVSFLMVGMILAVGFVGEKILYNKDLLKYPWSKE